MSQAYLYCGTGVQSIGWQLVNSSGTVLQSGTCTSTSSTSITGSLYNGNKIKFTNIVVKSGYNSSTLKWHYNSGNSTSPSNSYTYGNNYRNCTMDYTGYNRYGYWTAEKNTTYDTVKVKISSSGVTATVWYYDNTNTRRELTLSAGGSLTFDARSGSTSAYAGATNIGYASGYTTPITWRYNTSSGGTSSTTIANGGSNSIDTTYERTITISATEVPTTYTYYYRVNLYIDGSLYDYATDSKTSSASTGTNISLATAQSYFSIGSGYSFSSASAGAYCTYSNGYFTITSTSSSSRSVCNLYYVTNTYDYLYRVRLYLDGSLDDYVNGSVSTTGNSGYLTLAQAQAMFSIAARYQFSSASAGNSYASYSSTYQRFTLTSTSSRGYCDLYYITKTYTVGATYGTGCSGMYSSITVNNAGSATVSYGNTATWRCTPATGYSFVGWYSDAACTSLVSSNAEYSETIYSSKTLYAKLQANTYTATASRSGFTCCFSSVTVSKSNPAYGESVTFTANLNTGYTFRGWYNASGTRVSTSRSYTATVTGNITLYARADVQWTYEKSEGSYRISAEEWTRLQTYITQRNGASFTYTATVGASLSANLYNDTRNGIGTGATVSKGQAITAALLNALITNANNL